MNNFYRTIVRCALLGFLSPFLARAEDVRTELNALIAEVGTKVAKGARSEEALAPDLAKFDALLAAHKGEATDDVARVLLSKAMLYKQLLGNDEKAIVVLKQVQAEFPHASFATSVTSLITSLETQKAYAVGHVFPDFAEMDMTGKPLSIANFKGKVVLLDFWATWCGPCLAELPNVVAAYKKYHDRGFEIIGISLDRANALEKLTAFTQNREMPWPQFYDGKYWENKLSTRYGIQSIPATFLLDGEGRVIAKDLRGPALEAELEKRLAAK